MGWFNIYGGDPDPSSPEYINASASSSVVNWQNITSNCVPDASGSCSPGKQWQKHNGGLGMEAQLIGPGRMGTGYKEVCLALHSIG